jgi:putative transposase
MRKLGLWAVRPKRNTSKPNPAHRVYPYLLRDKVIDRPNQVWATDTTYIPMRRRFLYLVAIIDWATRRVLIRFWSQMNRDPQRRFIGFDSFE